MNKHENFLKSILDTIHSIIYIFDIRTYSIVYANSQVEKQLGYTFEELSAMKVGFANNFFHPDDIPKLFADTEELIRFSDKKYVTNDFRVSS
jgi:PAS domain S-box-containing protein